MEGMNSTLWEALNEVMGTREEVYIRQRQYVILGILLSYIPSGSRAEGLGLPGSDIDRMYCNQNITVIPEQKSQPSNTDLVMETNNLKSGFAKLRLGLDRRVFHKLAEYASAMVPVDSERIYLSSLLFRDDFISNSKSTSPYHVEPHGPCGTVKHSNAGEYDAMLCFSCHIWPYEANEWRHRHRKNNWPSQILVNEIVTEGCLLAPIGNPLSQESHMEWRISFSLAEKKLVHSMNHTQILCYGLLKLYLKHVIDAREDCKGLLCSYFLKTVLFYSIEDDDVVWDRHNILECFWTCFKRLFSWVIEGNCPNYFIKTNNMFEGKITGQSQRILIEHLHNLYRCGTDTIMGIPVLHDAWNRIRTRLRANVSIQDLNECKCDWQIKMFTLSLSFLPMDRILLNIEQIRRILSLGNVSPVDYMLLKFNLADFNTFLSCHLYNHIIHSTLSNPIKYNKIQQLSRHILLNCTGHDICTGLLQYATLNYLTGRYGRVVRILEDVLIKFRDFVFYPWINVQHKKYIEQMCGKKLNIEHKKKSAWALPYMCCVNYPFYPGEIEVEVNNYKTLDTIFIPPKVYSYVLIFLAYHRTGNIELRNQTLDKLCEEAAIIDNPFINEREKPIVFALLDRCIKIATQPL